MVLNVHKDKTDALNPKKIANEFVSINERSTGSRKHPNNKKIAIRFGSMGGVLTYGDYQKMQKIKSDWAYLGQIQHKSKPGHLGNLAPTGMPFRLTKLK